LDDFAHGTAGADLPDGAASEAAVAGQGPARRSRFRTVSSRIRS
jgi:hypothetical protein